MTIASSIDALRAEPQKTAHGVDQIGAVEGVEMEFGDALPAQCTNLLRGARGADQLS